MFRKHLPLRFVFSKKLRICKKTYLVEIARRVTIKLGKNKIDQICQKQT